jgi:cellulose synthase/poly-beta-1,6-N-acetylglucosamine synthase-like glycosyltransferase
MEAATVKDLKTHYSDRRWFIRLAEIFPGFVTWLFILGPVFLSLVEPVLVAYFIIAFDLVWLIKSLRLSNFLIRGYSRLYREEKIDWRSRLEELSDLPAAQQRVEEELDKLLKKPRRQRRGAKRLVEELHRLQELNANAAAILDPKDIVNVVILATYNETMDILEPSVKALLETEYDPKKIIFILAYEERGGEQTKANAEELVRRYGDRFYHAEAICHPDGLPGEVRGKGGNITYAGRKLTEYITEQKIDTEHVIVTTFDSDHRPGRHYFTNLTYAYCTNPNRVKKSFQPIPMFYNNIWEAPAPMRVIATGSSFWMIMESVRPKRMRNFAAHAQSLKALIDTDYWSVTTIVEDGHQYWRTYFTYEGDHEVVPIYTPVYQDAVLAEGYWRTFKSQYLQLRRWAWGVSDFSYVLSSFAKQRRIKFSEKVVQMWRLFEGHFSWATAPLILTFVAWLPLFLNRDFYETSLAHNLPVIASRILTIAMVGLVVTIFISMLSLPPKPPGYKRTRTFWMLAQWVLLPVVTIVFSAFAAIEAQTRLMVGRRLDFNVTEKAVRLRKKAA